jgi:hypothetical protein
MRSKIFLKGLGYVVLLIGILLFALFMMINYLFFNIDRVPEGEALAEKTSPSSAYTVVTYVINAHSTVAPAVRGEVTYHDEHDKKRNFYWAYRMEQGEIEWINEHVVSINGMELDVREDTYDFRKD